MKLSEVLRSRGYVYQHSSETLEEITDGPKRTVYLGVDPTADSIHAGNLVCYMLLRRFADAGHNVILLIGGGTGMIGDPKPDVERPLLSLDEIEARSTKLTKQAEKLLGDIEVLRVNNADWLTKLNLIEFLREIGKHFTVNSLVKKDAISARMGSDDGISYTEFTYPLLQAYDFLHLNREYACDVQIGGSDQWGNIVAGVDLIRRKENKTAFALTLPLIVDKATGKKFGKSEGNAIWLDPEKTSESEFYNFWFNASDQSVEDYLKLFTLLSDKEIADTMEAQHTDPSKRIAQRRLAVEVTTLVHGAAGLQKALAEIDAKFGGGDTSSITPILMVFDSRSTVASALVHTGQATSMRDARQLISESAISINDQKISEDKVLTKEDLVHGKVKLQKGKKSIEFVAPQE